MLPRRKPQKLRQDAPKTEWPKHRAFVRRHECIVPGCALNGPIECCHVRKGLPARTPSWARGGTAMKPHDAFTFPACQSHHAYQHLVGETTFAEKFGIVPLKEAMELARNSPCPEIKEFIRSLKA